MTIVIQVLAVFGLIVSLYALYVEWRYTRIRNFKPWCDISEKISCTKVLSSRYGHLLGIPNAAPGVVFYIIVWILAIIGGPLFLITLFGVIASIYLAYTSFFELELFCVVCGASWIVNILLFLYVVL